MSKSASLVLALAALAATGSAAPASAQSMVLMSAPIVYVASPVVQAIHQGQPVVQPSIGEPAATTQGTEPAAFVPRPDFTLYLAALPRWQPPVTIDRSPRDYRGGLADYGPFRVLDSRRVALIGETDATTPHWFRAMLRDHPGLAQLDMVECPGTQDDHANMALGRMIRAAQMVTYVPSFGSVRSGAVELFLAGATNDMDEGAEFAVHSWRDLEGREADDFAEDAPENRKYIEYYREMGMSEADARAFYDFTNSVPHARALWLAAADMRRWTAPAKPGRVAASEAETEEHDSFS